MKKIFVMIAMMLPMVVMAQDEKDPTVSIPQEMKTFMVVSELSNYGYANNDALSLIQAARLSKQAGFTESHMAKTETSGVQTQNTGTKKGQITVDPAKLLADAKAMAGNDGVLLALIDDVNTNVRGAVGGPKYHRDRVLAHDYDVYEVTFKAGELARVTVNGDDDTDLDLYIYDSNMNLITKDIDYLDYCICTWTPRWTGKFYIKIVNLGNVYNEYVLQTN